MKGPLFYAKILLFGEYGIIKNSKGLSIPYNSYNGCLNTSNDVLNAYQKKSNRRLREFANFLKDIDKRIVEFDHKRIALDLSKNMYFDSSIPQGYGIGSSGALVASIYDCYAFNKIEVLKNLSEKKLQCLKKIFSHMESFFHGKSSGLDPLNSYLSLPIFINSNNYVESTGIPSKNKNTKGAVFLLDTGIMTNTKFMVKLFFEKMKKKSFSQMFENQFISKTDSCVEHFLKGNIKALFINLKELSLLVFNNFEPMIPDNYKTIWKHGIHTNIFYFKLCGSGGGGYILGFTKNWSQAKKELSDYKLQLVCQL